MPRIPAILLWLALLSSPTAGRCSDFGRPTKAVQGKRKELIQIQQQLETTRREIEEYRKLEESLGGELHRLERGNKEGRRRVDAIRNNIRLAESRQKGLKTRLTALTQASGFWNSELDSDVRAYQTSLASRDEEYGTAELWQESFRRSAILEKSHLLAGLQGVSRKTIDAEAASRREAADLLSKSRKAEAEQMTRQKEYENKQAAMAEAAEKKQSAIRRAVELEETAKALTQLIKTLSARKPGKAPSARLDIARNSLAWPAAGTVIQAFGKQRNAELNTWVIHQGILLATAPGASVSAVRPGKVIFAGPFRSYGQVLIVDHGSGLFGVYGDLGSLLKEKGAAVRAGETIARAGDGGDGKGRLYLELRHGAEALDPLAWLGTK